MKKAAIAIALSSALFAGQAFSGDEAKSSSNIDQFDEHRMQMHNDQDDASR